MRNLARTAMVFAAVFCAAFGFVARVAAADAPLTITLMTRTFSGDPAKDEAGPKKAVEDYCNVKLKMIWVPSTSYDDKMNLSIASGDIPMIMLAGSKTPSIVKAVKDGAFWEIGPYLKEYPNLGQAHPVTLWNSSFEGKTYGLYSNRPLGRYGITYRSDWLKNVGLKQPVTIDDFYRMLVAFKEKDPDGNGKADTYGMVATKYAGPFKVMMTWFGAPNEWGEDAAGSLVPAHMTSEYMDCLKFWKKMYVEKLINEDFAVMDPNKWNDPIFQNKAGVIVDCINTVTNKWNTTWEKEKLPGYAECMGPIVGPKGARSQATTGYGSLFLFSKTSIKDLATLKKVLAFEDRLGDRRMQDTCSYGIEGRHYNIIPGGWIKVVQDDKIPKNELNDLNQILPFIPSTNLTPTEQKPWVVQYEKQMKDNEKYVVGDPTLAFVSPTMGTKGAQLNTIVEDARVQFIVGQIDEKGFNDAVALWRRSGGDQVIKEFNDDYKKLKK